MAKQGRRRGGPEHGLIDCHKARGEESRGLGLKGPRFALITRTLVLGGLNDYCDVL
jgi:hypothetical protein